MQGKHLWPQIDRKKNKKKETDFSLKQSPCKTSSEKKEIQRKSGKTKHINSKMANKHMCE